MMHYYFFSIWTLCCSKGSNSSIVAGLSLWEGFKAAVWKQLFIARDFHLCRSRGQGCMWCMLQFVLLREVTH